MSIPISGPQQPGIHIDLYLRPLVDDLKILWSIGVTIKRKQFTPCGMLFTTIITDIPGGHSMSSQSKGDKDYVHCLDYTKTLWLNN